MEVFYANSFTICESKDEDSVALVFGFQLPGEKPEVRTVVMSHSGFKSLILESAEELKKIVEAKGEIVEWKKPEPEPPSIIIS